MAPNRRSLAAVGLAALVATVAPLFPAAAQTAASTGPVIDDPGPVDAPPSATSEPPATDASVRAGVGQYSAPEWLPLRNPANVGCVRTNCEFNGQPYHGSWAIDFLDPANQPGDPIFAAGAGQATINQTGSSCGGSGTPGNSVRIDHGGGVISLYAHLNTISITSGQWVDQNTQLGTMGTTGVVNPCPSHHLHYHVQVNGTRIDPGPLKACHGTTLVSYPQVLGFSSWDSIEPPWEGPTMQVRSDGTACAGGGGNAADPIADFTGDDRTDVAIYRPSTGQWYIQNRPLVTWGATGDVPVPADYNGNGSDDVAIYRPSTGQWFIQNQALITWGSSGDVPVPGDYDGDGDADAAVYRPSTGQWFVRTGSPFAVTWGAAGAVPVPADYDGDGDDDVAIYRPTTGEWYVRNGSPAYVQWGTTNDIPVPADYDGDGDEDIAIYRPSTGQWFIRNQPLVTWGANGDVPVPGDFNGGGAEAAIYRPTAGQWFVRNGTPSFIPWGTTGDIPLALPWAVYDAYF